ncbi:MAG: archaeal proteasome endopeptidase complex subunit beta [Thermoproteota archaeon]
MAERMYMPGATAIGVVFSEGVILASERRMSYGTFIMSKSAKKLFKITDKIGLACAGLISDMQILVKEATYFANMYKFENNREIATRALSKLLSNLLFSNRMFPLITQTLVGGFDMDKPGVYVLDPVGSVIQDDYAAVGTGAEISLGILEASYKPNMSYEESKEMVIKALKAAVERDSGSGNGFDIMAITKKGIIEEFIPA